MKIQMKALNALLIEMSSHSLFKKSLAFPQDKCISYKLH